MVKSSSRVLVGLLTRGIAHAADLNRAPLRLAQSVASIAEAAYACRDFSTVKEASDLLIDLPVPSVQASGLWYRAIVNTREGRLAEAAQILNDVVSSRLAEPRFRARALQSLGGIHRLSGDLDQARKLYLASAQYIRRASPQDYYAFANAIILHSLVRAEEGDNKQALKELLSIGSFIRLSANPVIKAQYYNNVAVELLELGRVSEAAHYSRIACLSPLNFAYPEWKETAVEIERQTAKRNAVAVDAAPEPRSRRRPAQPDYLLVVLQYSPPVRGTRPVAFRQRVSCNNPTVALVTRVARIRAPSFSFCLVIPNLPNRKKQLGQSVALPCFQHPIPGPGVKG
jgi:tetratricopeptide (TPR) repeat protein